MRKKILKQRIRNLEMANRHIFTLLSALVETVKPKRCQWPMFALRDGLTAEEADDLQQFWTWAMRQDQKTLTKEALVEYFEAIAPARLQGKLPAIAKAELNDELRVFISKLLLGLETTNADDDGDA